MIYFFTGAPKHGSHFQMFIVQEAMEMAGIPFTQVGNKTFHERNLWKSKMLLDTMDKMKNVNWICKGHFGTKRERDLLLSYDNIKIFLIWRDIRDVLVSQYYALMNNGQS